MVASAEQATLVMKFFERLSHFNCLLNLILEQSSITNVLPSMLSSKSRISILQSLERRLLHILVTPIYPILFLAKLTSLAFLERLCIKVPDTLDVMRLSRNSKTSRWLDLLMPSWSIIKYLSPYFIELKYLTKPLLNFYAFSGLSVLDQPQFARQQSLLGGRSVHGSVDTLRLTSEVVLLLHSVEDLQMEVITLDRILTYRGFFQLIIRDVVLTHIK